MVRAIDIHVHIPDPTPEGRESQTTGAMARYFGAGATEQRPRDVDQLADLYAELDMMAVLLTIDTETVTGRPPTPLEYIADAVKKHPDRFMGFGAVDPHKGRIAVDMLDRVVDLGLKGLNSTPARSASSRTIPGTTRSGSGRRSWA